MRTKLEYVCKYLSRGTHKKYETYVVNAIYSKLNNLELEIVTQQYVLTKEGRRFIDLYFPQIKVAVEVDEPYHEKPEQKNRDEKRMNDIKLSVLDSIIIDKENDITFLRIKFIENGGLVSLEMLNNQIDKVVENINEKIAKLNKPLVWEFDKDTKLQAIIDRGYLVRGDSFEHMEDILHVFGKKVKAWRKCTYKEIWSPTLSVEGSNRGGWINTITEDLNEIFESGVGGKQSKNKEDVQTDIKNSVKRYVFLKYEDALKDNRRRFLGVYKADRFDENKQAEVWKYVSDKVNIKVL